MTSEHGAQREIHPSELREGDVVAYMIKDVLARPGDPLVPAGEWTIIDPESQPGMHIGVDDEGRAYDVPAVTRYCRPLHGGGEEPKVFPFDQMVRVRRHTWDDSHACSGAHGEDSAASAPGRA